MASTSNISDATAANNQRRHSSSRQQHGEPDLGWESYVMKPVTRSTIDVDARFLPFGISPGMILEIKGPEKSGKTFLLTYFIARLLAVYPGKKAVLINTRHKFNVKSFLSVVSSFDTDLKNRRPNFEKPLSDLLNTCSKLREYMDRLLIITCYSAEDLMLTLGPSGESVIQKLLLNDETVSLVAIDSIDSYSYAKSLKSKWANQWPTIMESLRESVSQTKCPVICTTLIPANKSEYLPRRLSHRTRSSSGDNCENPSKSSGSPAEKADDEQIDEAEMAKSNFPIDYSIFSRMLEIVPASQAEKDKKAHLLGANKTNHYAYAYLRSKHSANTAGSGENQRVKFSIFSDMLWVEDM